MESGRKKRRSREEWRALLGRFEASGLSLAAFCRAESVCAASVHRWRGLLGNGDGQDVGMGQAVATRPGFVDLGALQAPAHPSARFELTLELGGGLVLHLVRG